MVTIESGKRGTVDEQKGSKTNRLVVGKNLLAMSRKFRIFAKDLMTKESAEISTHKNTEYTETGIGFGEYVVWFGEKAEKFGDEGRNF